MLKRLFDIVISFLLIAITLPFWLVIAAVIKLDSPGSVFFRSPRVGRNGEMFNLYKFRSMARDASSAGPGITRRKDPRITRVGDLLRSWRIDEIPQLINVFLGEMSIVGPRPESPVYVAHYTAEQRRVLDIRPGMVSPTFLKYSVEEEILAVAGANSEEIYLSEVLPDKLRIEMAYVEQHTFWGDMSLLLNAEISLFRTAIQRARSNKHELAN